MKKYILTVLVTLATLFQVQAVEPNVRNEESGDITVAPQFVYATRHSLAGLGVQAQFYAMDNLRIAPEFIVFFRNNDMTAYNADLNVHYIIPKGNVNIYPLAGFAYARYKYERTDASDGSKWDEKHDRIGANIGVGTEYPINDMLCFFAEERFQLMKDFNQSVTVLGVRIGF